MRSQLGQYIGLLGEPVLQVSYFSSADAASAVVLSALHPRAYLRTWGVTLLYGLFLLLGYATVRLLGQVGEDTE